MCRDSVKDGVLTLQKCKRFNPAEKVFSFCCDITGLADIIQCFHQLCMTHIFLIPLHVRYVVTSHFRFGVEVHDFGKSWRSGLAFLALIKSLDPVLVDLRKSLTKEPRENIEQAFSIAHQNLGIPPLLEPEGKNN